MIRGIPMKAKIAVLAIFLILLPFAVAFAEDSTDGSSSASSGREPVLKIPNLSGEITMTGQTVGLIGNPSKYNEYRDNKENYFFGSVKLKYDDDKYWFYLKAEDIGYDTQHYKLDGGIYGIVKYYLEYKEIPHIYSLGDRTIFNGAGSANLTTMTGYASLPATRWNPIDYSVNRQQEGGGLRLDLIKPFYVEFSASRESRNGTRPITATNDSRNGPLTEFPQPIDYVTEVFMGEIGYITEPIFASAYLQYTDFTNNNENLYFTNISNSLGSSTDRSNAGQTDTLTLPPSNQNYNYGFKGSVELPLHSRFNVSLSGSDETSDARYLTSSVVSTTSNTPNPTYTYPYANGDNRWHGKVDNQNYSFVLTSHPIYFFDYSLFYKYNARQNKSDNPSATSSLENSVAYPVSYRKNNLGLDVSFKLPAHFILFGAYDYEKANNSIEYKTYTIPETTDNNWKVGLKWTGAKFMSAKIWYERMNRDGSNDYSYPLKTAFNSNATTGTTFDKLAPYKNLFDTGSQNRDKIKTRVNIFPVETLDIGLGYNYKRSTYPEATIGLQNSRSDEFYVDAGYTFGKYAKLNGYLAYEDLKMYSFMRVCTSTTTVNNCNPNSTTQDASNYNFDFTLRDKSFDYGLGLDVYVIPQKVTLRVQYDSVRSDGNADYTILNQAALNALGVPTAAIPTGQNNSNIDIPNMDLYRKNTILAKVMWNVTHNFSVALGYAFEHYHYDDFGYNNYPSTYTIVDSSGNVTYLTGAYSDPSYNASLAFLTLKYSFK
ncbi:MAG: MtrB/PioB family outer membrane beta-barrel protein [Nitrospirae bacterium]|nr:MtrB/PioB family outer membrane beta-barrel protein [Nitrospirota bacterium]MBF0536477.1 MtrB/PioB family outer membrane beta-barrel protein [Nitrospirota bacterium]MBF0618512.1 MtrB/PioB family outer membrane beta-barrel protein [Nitrospirota bacterium]